MKTSRRNLISILAGLAILGTTSCSPTTLEQTTEGSTEEVPEAGEVNLYSSRHYDTDEALYEAFTDETGIEVNLIEGKATELIEKIKNEGENTPADVLITVDVGNLWQAEQEGIFQPVSSEVLDAAIPENLRNPEGYWFGLSKRARVIAYDQDRVKPEELSSYEDLAEEEWQGRVCVRSSGNIYNQSLVAAKIAEKGEKETEAWLKGLVNNFAREPEGGDISQVQAIAAGECDVAIVNHYYVARMMQSEKPEDQEVVANIGVFFPNQEEGGTHVNISGAGVVANAPHKENAIKFIEFLTTPEAQEIFANGNNEIPMVESVEANPTVASFGDFEESELNVAAYGKENPEAVKLMDKVGWK
ncbi:MAG: Fe(3+) ABC transporter substrate-binding protein [Spirulinaceae cyanobacterium]